jgi:hypothetical protein
MSDNLRLEKGDSHDTCEQTCLFGADAFCLLCSRSVEFVIHEELTRFCPVFACLLCVVYNAQQGLSQPKYRALTQTQLIATTCLTFTD